MRVLHIIRGLLNSSGTTHIVGPLSEAQARLGADVEVALVDKIGGEPVLPDPELVRSRRFSQTLPFSNPGVSLPFAAHLNGSVAGFDVVHIHAIWNFPTYWGMRSSARAGVPFIVAPQGSLDGWALNARRKGRQLYERWFERPYFCKARFMQALSASEADQIRSFGITAPIVRIPNGIEPSQFDRSVEPLTQRLGLPMETRTLLFLSRLHPKKGVDILLRAFARSTLADSGWTLVIAGDDAGSGYAQDMRHLAQELNLGDTCRFVGEVRGEEKLAMLKGADAFALPTHSEGLPIALLEALAAGLPVVTTPGANLPELVDCNGGLVSRNEPDAFANALNELAKQPEAMRSMAERGRKLVTEVFSWASIAKQTLSVYEEMQTPA